MPSYFCIVKVLVNTLTINKLQQPGFLGLIKEMVSRWAVNNKEINFYITSSKIFGDSYFQENLNDLNIYFNKNQFIRNQILFKHTLPRLIENKKIDLIIETNAIQIKSNRPKVLLTSVLPEVKNVDKILSKNGKLICFSKQKNEAIEHEKFSQSQNYISYHPNLIHFASTEVINTDVHQIKDGFTDGRNFFLLNIASFSKEDTIVFLKGFSQFKKWQYSNMKMVLLSHNNDECIGIKELLNTYKYKDDIVMYDLADESTVLKLIAASYCYIEMNKKEALTQFIHQSVKQGISVLTNDDNELKDFYKDALWFCNPNSVESIFDALKVIYKDEILKSKKIGEALQIQRGVNPIDSYDNIWNEILNHYKNSIDKS